MISVSWRAPAISVVGTGSPSASARMLGTVRRPLVRTPPVVPARRVELAATWSDYPVRSSTHSKTSRALSHRPHIAILDDEPDITALLAGYMESRGFRASQLHSGRALLALMSVDAPAIVLLDLGLPGEDGLAIARQLRAGWHPHFGAHRADFRNEID